MRSIRKDKAPNKKYKKQVNRDIYNISGKEKVYWEVWSEEQIDIVYDYLDALKKQEETNGELYKVYASGTMIRER